MTVGEDSFDSIQKTQKKHCLLVAAIFVLFCFVLGLFFFFFWFVFVFVCLFVCFFFIGEITIT